MKERWLVRELFSLEAWRRLALNFQHRLLRGRSLLGGRWQVLILSVVVYTFILVGLRYFKGDLLVLALAAAVFLAGAVLQYPPKPQVSAVRRLSARRVVEGSDIRVEVELYNQGERLSLVEIEDHLSEGMDVVDGDSKHLLSLKPGQGYILKYTLRARRGVYRFSHLDIRAHDPLGLISNSVQVEAEADLWVLPKTTSLAGLHLCPRQTIGTAGYVPARLGGPGVSFYGVRGYQTGDEMRWINWKASQRRPGEIYTNEFEQERAANVGIILDLRQATHFVVNGHSLFEYAVTAAASLAETLLAEGNRVGLMLYGQYLDWTYPGYGKLQRERILQALARAHVGESYILNHLKYMPTRLFAARSQLILVSPLVKDDVDYLVWLRARGYAVLLVSPNPVAFELAAQKSADNDLILAGRLAHLERDLLVQKLQRAGVQVLDWDVRQPLDQIIRAYGRVLRQVTAGVWQ